MDFAACAVRDYFLIRVDRLTTVDTCFRCFRIRTVASLIFSEILYKFGLFCAFRRRVQTHDCECQLRSFPPVLAPVVSAFGMQPGGAVILRPEGNDGMPVPIRLPAPSAAARVGMLRMAIEPFDDAVLEGARFCLRAR